MHFVVSSNFISLDLMSSRSYLVLKQFRRQKIESELSLFDKTNDPPHIQWPTLDADFRLFPSPFPQMTTKGFVTFAFTFSHLMSTFMSLALS